MKHSLSLLITVVRIYMRYSFWANRDWKAEVICHSWLPSTTTMLFIYRNFIYLHNIRRVPIVVTLNTSTSYFHWQTKNISSKYLNSTFQPFITITKSSNLFNLIVNFPICAKTKVFLSSAKIFHKFNLFFSLIHRSKSPSQVFSNTFHSDFNVLGMWKFAQLKFSLFCSKQQSDEREKMKYKKRKNTETRKKTFEFYFVFNIENSI